MRHNVRDMMIALLDGWGGLRRSWQVRCHLHLLAGRAEDRLSRSLQPGIARRLGLPDSCGPAARPLLDLFRYHAGNIVAAIESAPRPSARVLSNSHSDIAATKQA
jgi:UTP:GlnB (protein PII) uridylyltransferase